MRDLRTLLAITCRHHPSLQQLINLCPYLPINIRKGIMTLCRVQQSPWQNSRVLKSLQPILQYRSTGTVHSQLREFSFIDDILPTVLEYIDKPIVLGFISMIIRCIPFDDESSAIQVLYNGIDKEIECSLGEDRPQILQYSCLFGPENEETTPIHPYIPPRPELSREIKMAFVEWKV
jgi:hypothetical protein